MIDKLLHTVENVLPDMLDNPDLWDSLIVNRRKPHTYRVFSKMPDDENMRICLHKFDVCDTHEAFSHPHPWPGAFMILQGKYKMQIGYSVNGREDSKPADVTTLILSENSCYEITNPLTWHSVIPLEMTYTIMINGLPWDTGYAHKDVRTTKGKDLDKMPQDELISHLDHFKRLTHRANLRAK